jgi:predicted amidohydrolase
VISLHSQIGLQALAKELGVTILAGIHDTPEDDEDNSDGPGSERVFNTQIVIGPDGSILDAYRKVRSSWSKPSWARFGKND